MREVGRAEHASTEQLSAWLDGRAEPDEQGFLAGHVDGCIVCSNELADLRSVRELLRALPVYLPPRSFEIPVEAAPPAPRRFRRLIPLTRALGTVAAVLCVVLFSVDAMQTGYDVPAPMRDGSGTAMQISTGATVEAAQAAKPAELSAARSASESEKPADAAPKIANAPAAQPAAAQAPAATQVPPGAPLGSIANTVTATPAGVLARPAAESAARAADAAASGRAEGVAAVPPPPAQPAAAAAPQQAAAPAKPAAPAAAAPTPAQQAPGAAAKPQAPSVQAALPAPQPTSAAFAPGVPAPTVVAPQASRSATTSPWLSPIRLWSLTLALVAAALLIGSLVLSLTSRTRTGAQDEWG